ncbi:hypothetical protein [Thermogemmatispora carboxidivorans]|uniref:hypothetical protein n=1 Tax=Thermogemmatispora carboxidivorans TaxID=1382306 RepID=UPI00069AB3C9|nr:hypothetical protein [Thermogemmatispora carboxidivorans]
MASVLRAGQVRQSAFCLTSIWPFLGFLRTGSRVVCVWYYIQQQNGVARREQCGDWRAGDLCGEQSEPQRSPSFFSAVHLRQNTVIT